MTVQEWLGENNKLGIDIWNKKYCHNGESFDAWLDRVSGGNEEVRQLIIDKKFLFGGRILSNRNVTDEKVTYSNCYVIAPPEDNIESIYDTAKKLARTYSYGGGCGIDISKLAPRGAKIGNQAKTTSGAVSFMDTFNQVTEQIGQNGRRGALMISIDCTHPDLEEFIGVKQNTNKVTSANISVRVSDDFMFAVDNNLEWELEYTRPETGETITKTVDAGELYHKLCENNWNYAEPGLLFWDRISGYNMLNNNSEFEYAGTNPCVRGDTLVLTDKGYFPIAELANNTVNVWNGYEFSTVTPHETGANQRMLKITMSNGMTVDCTPYHKFLLKNGTRKEAKDLVIGDALPKWNYPVITTNIENDTSYSMLYTKGFFTGDGGYHNKSTNQPIIYLYDKKKVLLPYLTYESYRQDSSPNRLCLLLDKSYHWDKQFVPNDNYTKIQKLSFLAGVLDSDGTTTCDGAFQISSINLDFLKKIQLMLTTLGIHSTIGLMKVSGKTNINGIEYNRQNCYRLSISSYYSRLLIESGLECHRLKMKASAKSERSHYITVANIEIAEDAKKVYCMNEPKNHTFIANGILVGNCAEEPLPAGGSCLLGSLNLAAFVYDGEFQMDIFNDAVTVAVEALNDVLDEGLEKHPLQEQRGSVRDWRQIGLGIMGLADMLIKCGIRYGSPEAIKLCNDIGENLAVSAIVASQWLAETSEPYPKFNEDLYDSAFYSKHIVGPNYPLRNSQLLTIAPTGTLSTMLGISGGIEPIFANSYTRTTKSLHGHDETYKVYTPIVDAYMKEYNLTDEKDLPNYFVTSADLSIDERIAMQAIWQEHIDASISSTINLPNETTVNDVEHLYMKAWQAGLKGVTVYRAGCAREGILVKDGAKKEEKKEAPIYHGLARGEIVECSDQLIGRKRKLQTGCGSLHVEAFFDPEDYTLREVFFSKGSTGGCNNYMIGLSRTISLLARAGVDIYTIQDQLNSTGACPSYAVRTATKHDTSKGSCCPMAIGNALVSMYEDLLDEYDIEKIITTPKKPVAEPAKIKPAKKKYNYCPECGEKIYFEGGCNICKACGWSKCN